MIRILSLLFLFKLFVFESQSQVIINEFLPDPSPAIQLPEGEFIELFNRSNEEINLENWSIADASSQVLLPAIILPANEYLILCNTSDIEDYEQFGTSLGINLPTLNNNGDDIIIRNDTGQIVDELSYTKEWYQDALKEDGGWSIERINPLNDCDGQQNWKASIHSNGGSPGTENSIIDNNAQDNTPIQVESVYLVDDITLEIIFSKQPNENQAILESSYSISPNIAIANISLLLNTVFVEFEQPISSGTIFSISINQLQDCTQLTSVDSSHSFGKAEQATFNDIIINEILFNPLPNQSDFIEIKNRSDKLISIDGLVIVRRDVDTDEIVDSRVIENTKRYAFPNDIIVFTNQINTLVEQYTTTIASKCVEANIPNFPDEEGAVQILNQSLEELDKLTYHENWHYEYLNRLDGVSLERLDEFTNTQDKNNWYSASIDVNYASPTQENSQMAQPLGQGSEIILSHELFSPDLDGIDDFVTISVQTSGQGNQATIIVYNLRGYPVKTIVNNQLIDQDNQFRWTGLNDNNEQLPLGHYFIVAEITTTDGSSKVLKEKVVLSRTR